MAGRVKQRRTGSRREADMAQRALGEYEEAQRRRELERQRQMGGAMNEMNRSKAIALIDEVHAGYEELCRTGRCPACEAISTITEVVEKHVEHEAHEAALGREADAHLQWQSVHSTDCSFMSTYRNLPALAAVYHIVLGVRRLVIVNDDGSGAVHFAPVRIPDPGDPPVPD